MYQVFQCLKGVANDWFTSEEMSGKILQVREIEALRSYMINIKQFIFSDLQDLNLSLHKLLRVIIC